MKLQPKIRTVAFAFIFTIFALSLNFIQADNTAAYLTADSETCINTFSPAVTTPEESTVTTTVTTTVPSSVTKPSESSTNPSSESTKPTKDRDDKNSTSKRVKKDNSDISPNTGSVMPEIAIAVMFCIGICLHTLKLAKRKKNK